MAALQPEAKAKATLITSREDATGASSDRQFPEGIRGPAGATKWASFPQQETSCHHTTPGRASLLSFCQPPAKPPPSPFHTDLNGSEVFIELGVQGRQFVHRAVEDAVVVPEQLAQEEGCEGHVHHNSLGEREETGSPSPSAWASVSIIPSGQFRLQQAPRASWGTS